MIDYNYLKLLERIGNGLLIKQGIQETKENWMFRVLYSIVGLQILASLYDYEEEPGVSIQHVRKRAMDLVNTFDIFEKKIISEDVVENIIHNFRIGGFILHKKNNFLNPPLSYCQTEKFTICRGLEPWYVKKIFGILPIIIGKFSENSYKNYIEMFDLMDSNIIDWFDSFLKKTVNWTNNELNKENYIYLNIYNNYSKWSDLLPQNRITLYRNKNEPYIEYGLIKTDNTIKTFPLSDVYFSRQNYQKLVISLKNYYNVSPKVVISDLDGLYCLEINSLLPGNEQNFFELATWPSIEILPWKRYCTPDILGILKDLFNRYSYNIVEV